MAWKELGVLWLSIYFKGTSKTYLRFVRKTKLCNEFTISWIEKNPLISQYDIDGEFLSKISDAISEAEPIFLQNMGKNIL